jgi:hypothetical protein
MGQVGSGVGWNDSAGSKHADVIAMAARRAIRHPALGPPLDLGLLIRRRP